MYLKLCECIRGNILEYQSKYFENYIIMYNNKRDDKMFQVSMVDILPLILHFQAFVLKINIKIPIFDLKGLKKKLVPKLYKKISSIIMIGPKRDY